MASIGISGLGQLAITVTDVDRAVAFYQDVLGLGLLFTVPDQQMAFLDGGNVRLYLSPAESAEHRSQPITYWTVEDLSQAEAAVAAAGAEIVSPSHRVHGDDRMELWMFFTCDPDGNLVALMQERTPDPR
jgi:predicted enzyme related to lactoylglutathione lyase